MQRIIGMIVAMGMAIPVPVMAAEGTPAAGKTKAETAGCFSCHGAEGFATATGIAADKRILNLAGQPDLFLRFQLVYFRSGTSKSQIMNGLAQPLSDKDIRNLAAFFASLPPARPPPDPAPEQAALGAKVAQAILAPHVVVTTSRESITTPVSPASVKTASSNPSASSSPARATRPESPGCQMLCIRWATPT